MFRLDEIRRAHELVLSVLRPTLALKWPLLSARVGTEVIVKHENHLPTGAFKVRGGLVYMDALRRRAPIGQGSGVCGCIAARDALGLKTEIDGVQATGAPAYALSF